MYTRPKPSLISNVVVSHNFVLCSFQFTCAAPSYITGFGDANSRALTSGFVWVCNSDGYVGQVCLLSMIPEAQSKASLSVCQSRIACIAVVPGARIVRGKSGGNDLNKIPSINDSLMGKKIKLPMKQQHSFGLKHKKSLPSDMSDEDDDEFGTGAENIMAFDSSGDEDDIHSPFIGTFAFSNVINQKITKIEK